MAKEFSVADLIGYLIGIFAIIYAIIVYYRARLDIEKLSLALQSHKENTTKIFGSLNDIAFGSLLRVKNFPANTEGLHSQRDSLVSALAAIQRITAREGDKTIFQGEYITGGELGAIEDASGCVEVWIITQDLRPDIEEDDLLANVAQNVLEGRRYFYLVPNDIPQVLPHRLTDLLLAKIPKASYPTLKARLSIVLISRLEYMSLFSNGLMALYVIKQNDQKGAHTTIGFDEVVLPNERRGSLWQRQPEEKAKSMILLLRQAAKSGSVFRPQPQHE